MSKRKYLIQTDENEKVRKSLKIKLRNKLYGILKIKESESLFKKNEKRNEIISNADCPAVRSIAR